MVAMVSSGGMDGRPQARLEGDVPELAWVAALSAEGKYTAAAEAAQRAFAAASGDAHFPALCEWEELAFILRPGRGDAPHRSVAGVNAALIASLGGGALSEAQRAMAMARLARQRAWQTPAEALPQAEEAYSLARRSGDPHTELYALLALHMASEDPALFPERMRISEQMAQVAHESNHPNDALIAHWRRQMDCLVAGDSPGYDYHLDAFTRLAYDLGDRHWLALATMARATNRLLEGEFADAEGLAGELAPFISENRVLAVLGGMPVLALKARFEHGRGGSPETLARIIAGARSTHASWRIGLAYFLASSGRTTEAAAELAAVDLDTLPADSSMLPCLCIAIDLGTAYLNDATLVGAAYRRLLPSAGLFAAMGDAGACWGPVDLYLGIAAKRLGLPEAEGHLSRARLQAAALRARPALARATLLLGTAQAHDSETATTHWQEALAIAERIGYVSVAAEARALLRGDAPVRSRPSKTELTAREREILALVATGLTAAEVAARLVLSPRTVEKHLEHAYAKIGARNRAEGISWAIVNGLTQVS